jgi:apolipoprotein N-acyltransferase
LGKYNRTLTQFTDPTHVAMNAFGMGYRFQPFPDPQCYLLAAGYSWTRQPGQRKFDSKYVSAYLFDPQEQMVGRHDKIELMPGGEYVPGQTWFPALANLGDEDDPEAVLLSRGTEAKPIGAVNESSIAVMLCCEDMFPSLARDMTNRGADILVCLANGMCFNSEVVLQQHFNISRFRAIENNRYFLRCGSFGVSCLVSPTGKVLQSLPVFEEADLKVAVPVEDRPLTLFNRLGDTLTWGSYLLLLGFVFNSLLRRKVPKSAKAPIRQAAESELN